MDLLDLRKRIDEIDSKLIPLFIERMGISKEVAEYKVKNGMPVLNEKREKERERNVCIYLYSSFFCFSRNRRCHKNAN